MSEQKDHEIRYVILTQEILEDSRLNAIEKIVLARITGFDIFFESASETAKLLNTSELVIQRAKRKLEKIGYIKVIEDKGRGKTYRASLWKKQGRYNKNVDADITKKLGQPLQKSQTENKYRIKKEKGDESIAEPVEKSKKEYGRTDINELVALWEKETGISIAGQQNQRRQLYNLVKKYGLDATKALVKRVGVATHSPDRFAPRIATPSDLTGKYSKLPKLELWENRAKFSKQFGSPAPKMATASLTRGVPEYNGAWDEQTDEERAEVSAMMQEFRSKLGAK